MGHRRHTIAAIHCWADYDQHGDPCWSVSTVDDEGDEITCVGGDADLAKAWALACEHADSEGVPAVEIQYSGEETDRYTPEIPCACTSCSCHVQGSRARGDGPHTVVDTGAGADRPSVPASPSPGSSQPRPRWRIT